MSRVDCALGGGPFAEKGDQVITMEAVSWWGEVWGGRVDLNSGKRGVVGCDRTRQ